MRVALYERVSTDEQAVHGLSLDAQDAVLTEWAKDHEHDIVDRYVDPGISGRKPYTKRPEMMRLLGDVEAGKIDLVIFCKLDRWFRSVKEYYKVQEILDRHSVAWRAVQEDYETETASGRFKVNIMLSVAQDEAERTAERVKVVFDRKRQNGEELGGKLAYGIQREGKVLVPSDDAPNVAKLYDQMISVRSMYALSQMTEELIGKNLTYNHIQKILGNHRYVDLGIVSEDVFNEVQEIRKQKAPRTTKARYTYLFNGLMFCPVCGRRMSGHARTDGKPYYYCRHYVADRMCENRQMIKESVVEDFLLKNIVEKCVEVNLVVRQQEKKKKVDVSAIKKKMDKLTDLYMNDLIDRQKYEREYRDLQDRVKQQETQRQPVSVEELHSLLDAYKSLSKAAQRTFWNTVLERIEVDAEGKISFTLRIISSPREWLDGIQ